MKMDREVELRKAQEGLTNLIEGGYYKDYARFVVETYREFMKQGCTIQEALDLLLVILRVGGDIKGK